MLSCRVNWTGNGKMNLPVNPFPCKDKKKQPACLLIFPLLYYQKNKEYDLYGKHPVFSTKKKKKIFYRVPGKTFSARSGTEQRRREFCSVCRKCRTCFSVPV